MSEVYVRMSRRDLQEVISFLYGHAITPERRKELARTLNMLDKEERNPNHITCVWCKNTFDKQEMENQSLNMDICPVCSQTDWIGE